MEERLCAPANVMRQRNFDYGHLEPAVANFLRGQAERIRRYIRKSIIQLGKDLIEAKRHVAYGDFIRWVEQEVGIPQRTAQGYMRIAQWAEGRRPELVNLPVSVLYVLSAKTTTREVVDNVVEAIQRGNKITVSEIRKQISFSREANSPPKQYPESEGQHFSRTSAVVMTNGNLIEVAEILAKRLPVADRARIYGIMTDPDLLHDSQLGEKILSAFELVLGRSRKKLLAEAS